MAQRIIHSRMIMRGPRGAPGDMDPEEWDQWQADLAAKLPIADVLNEPDMATGATDKPPSQASVVEYVGDYVDDALLGRPPVTSDLLVHLDAQALQAADQDRISAWRNRAGSGLAVQATAGKQPRYDLDGINGRPALYFDRSRDDALVLPAAFTSHTVTIFTVVHHVEEGGVTRYFLGTDGTPKNMYTNAFYRYALQGASTYTGSEAFRMDGLPKVVTAIFDGASSVLQVNDLTPEDADLGSNTTLPTTVTIGHRHTQAAGQGTTAHIGEVLIYDRRLTTNEIDAVRGYLFDRWGMGAEPQHVWYVNSVAGDDDNDGRTPDTPLATLSGAMVRIRAQSTEDCTVAIFAPQDAPIRETSAVAVDTGGTVRFVPQTPGTRWHASGAQRFDGGWDSEGDGVYSQAVSMPTEINFPIAFVRTLLNSDGQPVVLRTRNTATPTTPDEGEYGYTGGTYYLHLPGGVNPNIHTVEIATANQVIRVSHGSTATITNGRLWGVGGAVVVAGTASPTLGEAEVYLDNTIMEFAADSGLAGAGYVAYIYAENCLARWVGNDGFNHHGVSGNTAIMELVDCEGAWNDDEGVSPHDDTRLILVRGVYHHNGSGGLTSVDNAETQLVDTEFHHNGRLLITEYGVNIDVNSRLISTNLYSHDNYAGGISVTSTAPDPWVDNGGTRSGVEHGNALPDSV